MPRRRCSLPCVLPSFPCSGRRKTQLGGGSRGVTHVDPHRVRCTIVGSVVPASARRGPPLAVATRAVLEGRCRAVTQICPVAPPPSPDGRQIWALRLWVRPSRAPPAWATPSSFTDNSSTVGLPPPLWEAPESVVAVSGPSQPSPPCRPSCWCPLFVLPPTQCRLRASRSPSNRSLQCTSVHPCPARPLCHPGRLRRSTPNMRWKMNTSRWRCGCISHSMWSPNWTRPKIPCHCRPRSFPFATFSFSKFGPCSWLSKCNMMFHPCLKTPLIRPKSLCLCRLRWMMSASHRRYFSILPSK
jgi:hypothetical protein